MFSRYTRGVTAVYLVVAAMLVATSAAAALKPPASVLPNYDAAGGMRSGLPAGVAPTAAQSAVLSNLTSVSGGDIRVTYNALTRAPRAIIGQRPLSAPSSDPIETIARNFLTANASLWNMSPSDVSSLRAHGAY